jgi:hypothetical protein
MIGKLDRDRRSGVRDQKKNNLGARWAAFETAGRLDNRGQGSGIRCQGSEKHGKGTRERGCSGGEWARV